MASREQLVYMLKTAAQVVKPLIEDITDEESMARTEHNFNHIRWQTGHLLHSNYATLALFSQEKVEPRDYGGIFGGGTELSDDPKAYPSMAELRSELLGLEDRIIALAEKANDDVFEREIEWGSKKVKVWQAMSFLCMHNFYHAGQITQIRKTLGRDRPFV